MRKLRKIYYSIKQFFRNIINLVKWIPVIYCDRDWHHIYIYKILYKKFDQMEKFHRSDKAFALESVKTANEIMIAKNLCKRLMDDNYLSNATMEYDNIYDNCELFTVDGNLRLNFTDNLKQRRMFSNSGKHADYMEKQDITYLFDHMKKHIQKWWD